MQFKKSTTIFLNVVLIIVALILIKFLISSPKNAYAAATEYKVIESSNPAKFLGDLNKSSLEGWSVVGFAAVDKYYALLKK
jgi:hypothetical protein